MCRLKCILCLLALVICCAGRVVGENYTLTDGQAVSGDVSSCDDNGLLIRRADGTFTERLPWNRFSQDSLRKLLANPRAAQYVDVFIDPEVPDRSKIRALPIKEVPRLERPKAGSVIGSFLSTGIGLFTLLLLYAANIIAGYEISMLRAYPPALVCGVSAVAPLVGPVIFLCLPTRMTTPEEREAEMNATREAEEKAAEELAAAENPAPPPTPEPAQETKAEEPPPSPYPPSQTFQRGQFTFNRRFFETKFAGFFATVKKEADKDMVLVFNTSVRGMFVAHRIVKISATDVFVEIQRGPATEQVTLTYPEIQEIILKHKDA